ncbi:MAG: hypothetical protein V4550_15815 [Gemmatimonadota bacterium]
MPRKKTRHHRPKNGATFYVNRRFPQYGVPRLCRSSGTNDEKVFDDIQRLLDQLGQLGSPEAAKIIQGIHKKRLTFVDALGAHQGEGRQGIIRLAEDDAPIDERSFQAWLAVHDVTQSTRTSYRNAFKALEKFVKSGDTMKSLPAVLGRYRDDCVKLGRNRRAFDIALAVAQAWVKKTIGPASMPYRDVRLVQRFNDKPDARKSKYFSPRDIMNIAQRLPAPLDDVLFATASYGTNPKEYFSDGFTVTPDGVEIHGEKSKHRKRIVPLLRNFPPVIPPAWINYRRWWRYVTMASNGEMLPDDARKSFARWMSEAGIPFNRAEQYQGHAETTQTATYFYHVATAGQLRTDGLLLNDWIKKNLEQEPPNPAGRVIAIRPRDAKYEKGMLVRPPKRALWREE